MFEKERRKIYILFERYRFIFDKIVQLIQKEQCKNHKEWSFSGVNKERQYDSIN